MPQGYTSVSIREETAELLDAIYAHMILKSIEERRKRPSKDDIIREALMLYAEKHGIQLGSPEEKNEEEVEEQ